MTLKIDHILINVNRDEIGKFLALIRSFTGSKLKLSLLRYGGVPIPYLDQTFKLFITHCIEPTEI